MVAMFVEGFKNESIDNPFQDPSPYPPLEYLSYPSFLGAAAFLFCVHVLVLILTSIMSIGQIS